LRGILKYLHQTLQIPVERPDSFKRLGMGPGVSPAKFHENVSDFGIVYGLALQGLGLARIESNLLPRNVARSMAWASKGRYFIAAACILLAVSLLSFARTGLDKMNYNKNAPVRRNIMRAINNVDEAKEKYKKEKDQGDKLDAEIEKEFEPFDYREVIPLLHETIISALPNEHNNPRQAELYKAFASGDVETIKKIPREQREQVFISGMNLYFTNDLEGAKFGGGDLWRKTRGGGPGMEDGGMDEYGYAMMMEAEMGMGRGGLYNEYGLPGYSMGGAGAAEKKHSGFVVQALCYSPYGRTIPELGKIIDPPNVDNQPDKWGFITRLEHLDDMAEDANSPFELFKKGDHEQFGLDIKEVTLDGETPGGIGVWEEIINETAQKTGSRSTSGSTALTQNWILIDPMTKETISKESVLGEDGKPKLYRGQPLYKVNDHWFVLNVKFVWRDAPEPPKPKTPAYGPSSFRPPATTTTPSTSRPSGKSLPDIE